MAARRVAVLLVLALASCGGTSTVTSSDAGHDASSGGSAGSAATGGTGGSIGFDAPDEPVDPWADSGPIDGGPFDCGGCVCNGATNYCYFSVGGAATLRDLPPDAAACPADAGNYGCIALPPACSAAPSCKCVMAAQPYSLPCACDDTGGGISVTCNYP